jgi:AraC-like DNA-binding protein
MYLGVPGTRFNFEYTDKRENWVCGFSGLEMRQAGAGLKIQDEKVWVPVAQQVPLTEGAAQLWGMEFQRIQAAVQTPVPGNALRARLILAGMLRFMMDACSGPEARSPAEQLRRLIDADESCHKNLDELSLECGYSSDYLRVIFKQEFHISPVQYRMQRRMARALDLVMGRAMSIKDISVHLGFPYVTHFSAAFRKAFGYPPSAVPQRPRFRAAPERESRV